MRRYGCFLFAFLFSVSAHAKRVVFDFIPSAGGTAPSPVTTLGVNPAGGSGGGLLRSRSLATPVVTKGMSPASAGLRALNVGDEAILRLFEDVTITTRVSRVSFDAFGPVYAGTIDGLECVSFLPVEGGFQIDAQVVTANRVYKVLPSVSKTRILEYQPLLRAHSDTSDAIPVERDPQYTSPLSVNLPTGNAVSTSGKLMDVLIVYDNGAAAWAKRNSGITNFAREAVAKANAALANTGLDEFFSFRLVGVTNVSSSYNDVVSGLSAIRPGNYYAQPDASFATIDALRTSVGADNVVLLVDTGLGNGTVGVGYILENEPVSGMAWAAYCCCDVWFVNTGHTMTHEIGHNLGAGHSDVQDSAPGPQWGEVKPYSSGYHFIGENGEAYHTIMGYDMTNSYGEGTYFSEIPFFSSPDYVYKGIAVGTVTRNDNTRVLRETYSAATEWRQQKIPVTYGVTFSPEDQTVFSGSLAVTLTPGQEGIPIYYTIDGSIPTLSSTRYTDPILITDAATISAVTYDGTQFSPVFTATYSTPDSIFGTSGVTWSLTNGTAAQWYKDTVLPNAMQNGDFTGTGTSVLTGVFTGKGTLLSSLETSSYTWQNGLMVHVDGSRVYSKYYDGDIFAAVVLTNRFTSSGPHTVTWTYIVNDFEFYFTAEDSYASLTGVVWIPSVTTNAVPVPYAWLDRYFPLLSTDAEYNTAALADPDRDGLTTQAEYIAGTDPTNAVSRFTADISITNGVPFLSWTPRLPDGEGRTYFILGATNLSDKAWSTPTNAAHRFFKVGVRMR